MSKDPWKQSRLMLSILDDFSAFVNVYFLKTKSEVTTKFNKYKAEWTTVWNEAIRTDNGGDRKTRGLN